MDSKNWAEISSKIKFISSNWTSYVLLGSFMLYLTGYLSLRFYMTILGLGTDITVFDERYFFTGVNFFIYMISTIPSIVLVGIVFYFPIKIIIKLLRIFILKIMNLFSKTYSFDMKYLLLIGIVLSIISIQFFMKQCFYLGNFLVSYEFSKEEWLMDILMKEGTWNSLYFPLLLMGLIVSIIIWWNVQNLSSPSQEFFWLKNLLSFLIVVQFLFLPINYGSLVMSSTTFPRVTKPKVWMGDKYKNLEVWLVWEGKEGVTYLTRDLLNNDKRTLVTFNKKNVNYQEILCYDELLNIVVNKKKSCVEKIKIRNNNVEK